jgi:type IV pilus assembly protein PilY1
MTTNTTNSAFSKQPIKQSMNYFKNIMPALALVLGLASTTATSALDLAQSPLITLKTAPGLVMLTMGRDITLSKAAYNDVNDLDGDGKPDLYFKPGFKYDGYFAYDRCYEYAGEVFTPTSIGTRVKPVAGDSSKDYFTCSNKWNGNFLNWVTMSRIDVLRKVLYGGKRSTDTTASTILERSYIPQDATVWGKEYTSILNDGYNIADYAPLTAPEAGKRHMFANATQLKGNSAYTTTASLNPPKLIVYKNRNGRIWNLIATERPILGADFTGGDGTPAPVLVPETPFYTVRVATCLPLAPLVPVGAPTIYEEFCTPYVSATGTTYKPTGLLQRYGESKTLAFGLLSGTYDKNYSGGVLRQNIDDFRREVSATTGIFTAEKGIVYHLNELRPWGFGAVGKNYEWDCGFSFGAQRTEGSCGMWGNPLGEMMYETLRYFSGVTAGSTAYTTGVGDNHTADNNAAITSPEPSAGGGLDLKRPAWINPFAYSASRTRKTAYPSCAKPVQMVIGDPKTSFDSDQLPGADANFKSTSFTDTLGTLNVSTEATAIWNSEVSQPGSGISATKKFFIGQVGTVKDGNPSAKDVTTFANIRGHGPDATTNQGSFYGASVARYGKYTGVPNSSLPGAGITRVDQISIALDSSVPQIKIPLNGKIISIIPLSKSIGGCSGMTANQHAKGGWQPTGEISAFFIERIANTDTSNTDTSLNGGLPYYAYNISYADNDQGSDNEKDAVVRYVIQQTAGNQLSVGLEILSEATCMTMHQGYVISGTTEDGVYLDVGGKSGANTALGYYLDTPKNKLPGTAEATGTGPLFTDIPKTLTRSTIGDPRAFSSGTATGGFVPHDMLWYAAKYGSVAQDANGAFVDYKLKPVTGDPENYYFANNPSKLASQIGAAFQNAATLSNATATAAVSSGAKVSGGNLVYQAAFDTINWGGDLRAFKVLGTGKIKNDPEWLLSQTQPAPNARNVVLGLATSTDPRAKTASFNSGGFNSIAGAADIFIDNTIFKYLLGERTNEQTGTGSGFLRKRTSAVGDFVNSDPLYIGQNNFGYSGTDYASFRELPAPNLIGIGSNDGFYRLIAAETGLEKLAFIPKTISGEIKKLADPAYDHQYYVDGPAAFGHVKFSDGKWKAVVASSLGAGGKAVFGLNASAPALATSADGVLWEFSSIDTAYGAYIGNVLNKPIVAQLNGAVAAPAVIFGNGINSANNKASLIVLNAETGNVIKTCTPTDTANTVGNGMTSIAQVSAAEDGQVDLIYAGDYKGNIWRINPKSANCDTDAVKVFTAANAAGTPQPITGELSIKKAPNSKSGYMVLFGTGQYSTVADPANKDEQTLYGVWDENTTTPTAGTVNATRANLAQYKFGAYVAATNTRGSSAQGDTSANGGKTWLETTGQKGWMLDLKCAGCATGERFLDKPLINGAITYFLSHIPSDNECQPSGNGWVTALDTNTGVFAKGFKDSDTSNSAFVPGAAPRGLFIITTTGDGTNPSAEYLDLSVNGTDGSNPNPGANNTPGSLFGDGGGTYKPPGTTVNTSFGSGNITQPPFTSRQVWRQIQ